MPRNHPIAVTLCCLSVCSTPLWAADLGIEPGEWESTTTMTMPMMQTPRTVTTSKCISEKEAKRDPLAMMLDEGGCELIDSNRREGRIDFEVTCQADSNVSSTGKGYFEADGDRASGRIEMTMTVPEMGSGPMTVVQEWEARRLGRCE